MEERRQRTLLLMADDDADDCMLMKNAIREIFRSDNFHCLPDGQELMDYLNRRGAYQDPAEFPLPDLILLDLNMPRKDGFKALQEIKENPDLRCIPVVIYTTSRAQEQIELSYSLGANSYIVKPMTFEDLVKCLKCMADYWFTVVRLPFHERALPCRSCAPASDCEV